MSRLAGNDIVVTTAFELIGVALLALLASANEQLGKIVIILMVGFALIWAMANTGFLERWLGKPAPLAPQFGPYVKGMV